MDYQMKRMVGNGLLVMVLLGLVACGPSTQVRFEAMYIDMDGTLLGTDHEPREATLKAIKRYKACGGKIGVATGRTYDQVKAYLPGIKPNLPIVLFNGAVLMTPRGEMIRSMHLERKAVTKTLALLPNLDGLWGTIVHEERETIVDRDDEKFITTISKGHIRPTQVEPNMATDYEGQPVKILLLVEPGKIDAAAKTLQTVLGSDAQAVISSSFTVEVLPVGVNKAGPIGEILAERNIDPRNALFFGDSGNDVEMLSQLGPGFAMANCRKSCCEASLARIGNNDTDAIADVIEKVVLTPECPELD
jgi:FMN hydrolase / 5-amino-6-(5-phospho-D-ribitylamino)uracil phosphatase